MAFTLRVLFTGLCVHAVADDTGEIAVLMPDARLDRTKALGFKQLDGTPAVPHAGYLRFDLANVQFAHPDPDPARRIPYVPDENPCDPHDPGPFYEVVHRFDREVLDFGLSTGAAVSGAAASMSEIPSTREIAPTIELIPHLFDAPSSAAAISDELLFRTILSGGRVDACPAETPRSPRELWSILGRLNTADPRTILKRVPGGLMWTRDVTDAEIKGDDKLALTITLRRFDDARTTVIPLRAVPASSGQNLITMKVANLCAENPLEWEELEIRGVFLEDSDFKWMYRLFAPPNGQSWADFLGGLVLPAPRLESQVPAAGGGPVIESIKDPPGDCGSMRTTTKTVR